jgi:hypothetical protein
MPMSSEGDRRGHAGKDWARGQTGKDRARGQTGKDRARGKIVHGDRRGHIAFMCAIQSGSKWFELGWTHERLVLPADQHDEPTSSKISQRVTIYLFECLPL